MDPQACSSLSGRRQDQPHGLESPASFVAGLRLRGRLPAHGRYKFAGISDSPRHCPHHASSASLPYDMPRLASLSVEMLAQLLIPQH